MTNDQIKKLTAGDYVKVHHNGRGILVEIKSVRAVIQCDNPRSGAHGHWAACVEWTYCGSPTNLTVSTSLHSDDYQQGEGHKTHDADGNRVSGYELVGHNMAEPKPSGGARLAR